MLHIDKSPEPRELCEYREGAHDDIAYGNMPPSLKDRLRGRLLDDQGHLCAYCMQRISVEEDERGSPKMRIEHYHDQKTHPEEALTWRNMLGVCTGGERKPYANHCDASKGADPVRIDPLDHPERHIKYSNHGKISSDDADIRRDLTEVLNLNVDPVKAYRRAAWDGFYEALKRRGDAAFTPGALQRELENVESKDARGRYREYRGYIAYFLRKKLDRSRRKRAP